MRSQAASMPGISFVISSPSSLSSLPSTSASSDLFDQSALSTLAQRLVEAARRAGADAADAVAVRGISQGVEVRDGRVEESERSEGDDVGLRVLVGKRQAVVSTNDVSGDGLDGEEITNEIPGIEVAANPNPQTHQMCPIDADFKHFHAVKA